jgi:hypothetical protein
MKKMLFILAILAIALQPVLAQTEVGIRAGGSLNNVSTPDIIDLVTPEFKYLPGFEFGIVTETRLNNQLYLTGELNYRDRGFRVNENTDLNLFNLDVPVGVRVDTRIRYLEMPVMLKYKFGAGPIKGYIAAGPEIGYALNGRIKTRANFLIDLDLTNTPVNLDAIGYERFDIGAVAGAGFEIKTQNGTFFTDLRFHQGFNDSFSLPVVRTNIRNHGFGFGAGYRITL